MRIDCSKPLALFLTFLFLSLAFWVTDSSTVAAATDPTVLQAKKEAEAKGFIFFATHDEIVDKAKKEGELRVSCPLVTDTYKPLIAGFKQKYPFITNIHIQEIQGLDATQRFIMEIKSGQAKNWDITYVTIELGKEYFPYLMKHDIIGMAKHGVLKIHPGMLHPVEKNILSVTASIYGIIYNRKLMPEDKAPAKWEDFLKPEFKGKKFVVDIRPVATAGLVPAWGLERTLDFARKLAAQEPVWGRGNTRNITSVSAGENPLFYGASFDSSKRAMGKDPTGSLSYKLIEPIPAGTLNNAMGILKIASHPHTALLWFEFVASPEGQGILDKYGPFSASVFGPGAVAEEVTRGKKLSVVDWNHFDKYQGYEEKVFESYGFPKAN